MDNNKIEIICFENGKMNIKVRNYSGLKEFPDNRGYGQYNQIGKVIDYLTVIFKSSDDLKYINVTIGKDYKMVMKKYNFILVLIDINFVNDPIVRDLIKIINSINRKLIIT